MRKLWMLALCCAPLAFAADTVTSLGYRWTVERAADWSAAPDVLQLLVPREPPAGQPRRPQKFALAEAGPFRKVTVEAEVKRDKRSVIIVYAWQDEGHYNYAHISSDAAAAVNVHNGMFHVFNGERVRISPLDGPASLVDPEWTPVKLVFDGDTGHCYVEVNGKRNPSLEAYDLSLRFGRVGLGSFDETGSFRKLKITGETRTDGTVGHR